MFARIAAPFHRRRGANRLDSAEWLAPGDHRRQCIEYAFILFIVVAANVTGRLSARGPDWTRAMVIVGSMRTLSACA
jgi:hypothetical protein